MLVPGIVLSFIGPGGHVAVTGSDDGLSLPTIRVLVICVFDAAALAILAIVLEPIGWWQRRRGSPMD